MIDTIAPPLVRGQWIPMTSDEFDAWKPDRLHGEWVDGKGIIFVTSSERHVLAGLLLKQLFGSFLRLFDLGVLLDAPFEMRLRGGRSRREPDLMVVLNAHRDRIREHWLEGPADLVIELLSPSTAAEDRRAKLQEYADAGVPEYLMIDVRPGRREFSWLLLDPHGDHRRIEPDAQGRCHSTVVPGLWLVADWVFMDPLPPAERLLLMIAGDAYVSYILAERERVRAGD